MKITICGSIAFIDEMLQAKKDLENLGHQVKTPPTSILDHEGNAFDVKDYYKIRKSSSECGDWVWELKTKAMNDHFNKVEWSDAILVLNLRKNDIDGYIGANTFLEMGVAMHLKKKVYLLNGIPEVSFKEEILGISPTVLFGDIDRLA